MKLRINNKVLFGDTESTVIGLKKHPEEDRVTYGANYSEIKI